MQHIDVSETFFEGAISFETRDGWLKPWRLPCNTLRLYPPEDGLIARAEMPAGVRLRFATDAAGVGLDVVPSDAPRLFDLTLDGELIATETLDAGGEQVRFDGLPAGPKTVELWLPIMQPTTVRGLTIDDGASVTVPEDRRPRWVHYGSSISHCGAAHSPARTWPATVARACRVHLTSMGYGGNCHMEPMLARIIRDRPADAISLKVGINIQGSASLSPRTFQPALIGFVQLIREGHPELPIAVISPIVSPPREQTPNAVGLSLSEIRCHVREAYDRLVACGDPNLHYFDGTELFGEDLVADYLPDLLHPNGDGNEVLGRNFVRVVAPTLFANRGAAFEAPR